MKDMNIIIEFEVKINEDSEMSKNTKIGFLAL